MTDLENPLQKALIGGRRFFTRAEVSDDTARCTSIGGREGDVFYRDRWSHDKVVRSTHGVNCTGSCSWKVYVKDGIITWEAQQTDYPCAGPGPAGVRAPRLPARRGVLLVHLLPHPGALPLRPRRAAGDVPRGQGSSTATRWSPGLESCSDPEQARAYKKARGKGGLVRASWDEATEIIAAAHVLHDQALGPGPDRRVLADPGDVDGVARLRRAVPRLIGGAMLSFYDWYADLPVASPQVFGDQTDVPESGDWWDAGYLIMWGSNVPVDPHPRRALDDRGALPRAEGRRGRARLRRQREVRRRVAAPPRPAPTARSRWRWATSCSRSSSSTGSTPYFDRLRQAVTPTCRSWSASSRGDGTHRAGKFLDAADLGRARARTPTFKTGLLDAATGEVRRPQRLARLPLRRGGRGPVEPRPRRRRPRAQLSATTRAAPARPSRSSCRASTPPTARRRERRGVPVRAGRRPRRDHRLRPAARAVRRRARGLPGPGRAGESTTRLRRPGRTTPAWQEQHHRRARRAGRPASRGSSRRTPRTPSGRSMILHGRGHQPLVPLRHDLSRLLTAHHDHRLPGRQRRRLGALRRAGEVPPDHRLQRTGLRAGLVTARRAR